METYSFSQQPRIAIIGLGYVGLPLTLAFNHRYDVVGFDVNTHKVDQLVSGIDATHETDPSELQSALKNGLVLSADPDILQDINTYIVTVPTDVDAHKRPDLSNLLAASATIGSFLKPGDLVIYESTTYPGCTEEECVPVLEKHSGLKFNLDFTVGYSPERINPGDKIRTLTTIKKVTSGSTAKAALHVDALYASIITAGTHLASSIKVAEASKAIENAQRDVNISFVNELALIFDRIGIDTQEVLEAAGTKWNFLPFTPGLVGGHCIGVDPYYLAHKAQALGYDPEVILSGRRVNESMGLHVAGSVIKLMHKKGIAVPGTKALLMGVTFKENCPDVRNSRVVDVYRELQEFGLAVDLYDPWADKTALFDIYQQSAVEKPDFDSYKVIVIAVAHDAFKTLSILTSEDRVIYDLKGVLPKDCSDKRL
ncbi:MAG: nucleotide sugar dehydrogenase [Schleiferiaceae bacterium]